MTTATKQHIQQALANFGRGNFANNARALFKTLGYESDRTVDAGSPAEFVGAFDHENRFNREKARLDAWQSVDILFQLTSEEIATAAQLQLRIGDREGVNDTIIHSYLFVAIALRGEAYTRTDLAHITREVNKLFKMPALILFKYNACLTLAIIDRRLHKRDASRDVLEKVTLIKDIRPAQPHRAHVEILYDLSLPELQRQYVIGNWAALHRVWQKTLDSSELNRRFFKEIADWYFWAVREVTFPKDAGPEETRNAVSVIRLITRLIFVWFIKEKGLVPGALFDERRLRDEILHWGMDPNDSTYYKAILQNLFFATLNQEMNNPHYPRRWRSQGSQGRDSHYLIPNVYRYESYFQNPEAALKLFANIPFLNGGLFECLDRRTDDGSVVRVDGFSDRPDNALRVPDELFFGEPRPVDLNAVYGTRGKTYKTRGLINILQRYKFTVEENTPIEQEIALDPELLGQVFENLLAAYNPETEMTARKQTGSFYTPREVVDYMVDESLLVYLETQLRQDGDYAAEEAQEALRERLRHLLAYNEDEPLFNAAERARLIRAIDNADFLDPACGSGAFLMGILHKLVFLLHRLDPDNRGWKERQIAKAEEIDEPAARQAAIAEIEQAFDEKRLEYSRKLYLIQNCIFGVDIQPIAVQIAKLRFFISLIVDQPVRDDRPNRDILPLPNLETRFVAANTLLRIQRPPQQALRSQAVIQKEQELERVRARLFTARTWETKRKYREQDKALRAEIAALLQKEGFDNATTALLVGWDPYDQNASAPFFDAEWMFGLPQGFDVVIGNPPYVRQEKIKAYKRAFQARYDCYDSTADLFVYFYEAGFRLLQPGGVLTYISSNKYFRSGYGAKLRRYLSRQAHIHQIIDFGDAPVFTAIAYPSIILLQKPDIATAPGDHRLRAFTWQPGPPIDEFPEIFTREHVSMPQSALQEDGWRLESGEALALLAKLRAAGTPLGDYVKGRFYYGIKTGLNEAFVVDRATRDRLIAEHPSSARLLKPFLRGRDVKRWRVDFAEQYLIFTRRGVDINAYPAIKRHLEQYKDRLMPRPRGHAGHWEGRKAGSYEWYEIQDTIAYWEEFEKPKIVYPDIAQRAEFAFDQNGYYLINTLYLMPTNELWLLGLLNSSTAFWFHSQISSKIRGDFVRYIAQYVSQLPVPENNNTDSIEAVVRQILDLKNANPHADVSALEQQIDRLVYELYALTPREIALVEGRSPEGVVRAGNGRAPGPEPAPPAAQDGRAANVAPPLIFTGKPPQGTFSERQKRVEALGKLGTPSAIQELVAALADESATIRWLARTHLSRIGGPEVKGVLQAYLEQVEDGPGREEAEKALGML